MMLVEMNPGKMQSEECRAALEMALAEAANMKEVIIWREKDDAINDSGRVDNTVMALGPLELGKQAFIEMARSKC